MSRRALLRWLLAGFALAIAVLATAFLGAGYYLQAPARAPGPADLIVALGGDNGARAVRVLELYRKGLAPRVLLAGPEGMHSKVLSTHQSWRATYLISQGIPAGALQFDARARNSWEEAKNALALMKAQKLTRALVVSDPPHLRRLDWVWGRVFAGSGLSYVLVASDAENWNPEYWWRTSVGAQAVFSEYLKLAYYVTEY